MCGRVPATVDAGGWGDSRDGADDGVADEPGRQEQQRHPHQGHHGDVVSASMWRTQTDDDDNLSFILSHFPRVSWHGGIGHVGREELQVVVGRAVLTCRPRVTSDLGWLSSHSSFSPASASFVSVICFVVTFSCLFWQFPVSRLWDWNSATLRSLQRAVTVSPQSSHYNQCHLTIVTETHLYYGHYTQCHLDVLDVLGYRMNLSDTALQSLSSD